MIRCLCEGCKHGIGGNDCHLIDERACKAGDAV